MIHYNKLRCYQTVHKNVHQKHYKLPKFDGISGGLMETLFVPDPFTLLPTNPLTLLNSKNTSPELKQYIRDNLVPNGVQRSRYSQDEVNVDLIPPASSDVFSLTKYMDKLDNFIKSQQNDNKQDNT